MNTSKEVSIRAVYLALVDMFEFLLYDGHINIYKVLRPRGQRETVEPLALDLKSA